MYRRRFFFSFNASFLAIACGLLATPNGLCAEAAKPAVIAKPAGSKKKKLPSFEEVTQGAESIKGLFTLHYNEKEQKLFMEIKPSQYNKDFILPMSIARGAGRLYLGGNTLNFGNQWVVSFRRSADRVHVIRRNVRYTAKSGKPEADAVETSYTDSVIKALRIRAEGSNKKVLVDLADLFMTDLAQMRINPDRNRSTWTKVKAFPKNIEIEVSAVFSMSSFSSSFFGHDAGVPDARGVQVVLHYSLSELPKEDGFIPRAADDRVGYFLSVVKDYSQSGESDPFVRQVARWKLQKDNPSEDLSPPKEPIIFWIEKSVPLDYRRHIREGILEWNRAFKEIGFRDAIQVRDQLSNDDFDAEDVRFNTFRWIATSTPFAMGPSRWNPKTGQILDADILFDESMVRYYERSYLRRVGLPESLSMLRDGHRQAWFKLYAHDLPLLAGMDEGLERFLRRRRTPAQGVESPPQPSENELRTEAALSKQHSYPDGMVHQCQYGACVQRQLALMAAVLRAEGKVTPDGKVPDEFIGQAIKSITMHEVGHTLGLRHNFKASTMLSLDDCNKPEITRKKGMSASVMDYLPANIAPQGQPQGEYFTTTIGPYDYWAIEYAYKPLKGNEKEELKKIAARIAEPGFDYATDEDLWFSPDPRVNTGDLGDPLEFAMRRFDESHRRLSDLTKRTVAEGSGWQSARESFLILLGELYRSTYMAAQYVGSEYSHRDHRGDPNGRDPLELVPLDRQREAMKFVEEKVLSDKSFQFTPELLRHIPPDYWSHWGTYSWALTPSHRYDIHAAILSMQKIVLSQYLSGSVLQAIQNMEMHAEEGQEVLTMADVFSSLTNTVWSELPVPDAEVGEKIEISTIRRNLQREHIQRLGRMVLGPKSTPYIFRFSLYGSDSYRAAPPDARALARLHLRRIDARINKVLGAEAAQSSDQVRAHLEQLHDRIGGVLTASLELNSL